MRNLVIKRYTFKQLGRKLKKRLREEVQLNFPEVEAFRTRFYYQIPPDYMFIAYIGSKIVGQRYLTTKVRTIDGKKYKVAGIGISVNPKFHNRGVGQRLTKEVLGFVSNRGYDFVMGTTTNPVAVHNLNKFGFIKLKRPMTYKDVNNKRVVKEKDLVFVKDFSKGKIIRELEKGKGSIYMGVGAW